MKNKVKIGIVGSRIYDNQQKVKDTVFKLKEKFGNELQIVSGGCEYGADKFAKKFALQFNCNYVEFTPAFRDKNRYSVQPMSYFNKPYHVSQFFHRNILLAEHVDYLFAFIPDGHDSPGTKHTMKIAKKHNTPITIINEK